MAMAFTCIDWGAEYLDGLVLVAMLRSEGIDAVLANENFVRQDWFLVFAYGGYRLMVPSAEVLRAMPLLAAYRAGELSLDESSFDTPACPHCASVQTHADPWPRRQVFAAFLACSVLAYSAMLAHEASSGPVVAVAAVALLALPLLAALFPCVLRWHLLRRYRCESCAMRWRAPAIPGFADLQRAAQD